MLVKSDWQRHKAGAKAGIIKFAVRVPLTSIVPTPVGHAPANKCMSPAHRRDPCRNAADNERPDTDKIKDAMSAFGT